MSKDLPTLVVTNPIWLALFRHGIEDPEWGRHPVDQHQIAMSIHVLATSIVEQDERASLQEIALRLMRKSLEALAERKSY